MEILSYTQAISNQLGSLKTKPAPYLHIGLRFNIKDQNGPKTGCMYAIWVWDNRECIESGFAEGVTKDRIKGKPVHDSKEPLKLKRSVGETAYILNMQFTKK